MAQQTNMPGSSAQYRQPEPLSDDDFDHTAKRLIEDAMLWVHKNWRPTRIDGWARYHGKIDLETKEGDDKTVSYEIRDAVQQAMPEIMEQLAGQDEPFEYYTHDPAKHDMCRQATVMGLSVFWENGGWNGLHDAVLHAFVGRIGFLKVYRDEKWKFEDHEFTGATPEQVQATAAMPNMMLLEHDNVYEHGIDDTTGLPIQYLAGVKGKIRRYYVESKLTTIAPDPDEMFCSQCVTADEALCLGQHTVVRMGNLVERGISVAELQDVSGYSDSYEREERQLRAHEQPQTKQDYGTWALTPVDMFEAYCLIDADGDGLLERWKILAAGSGKKVLRKYRVPEQPYVMITARRSPHTVAGLSYVDLLTDLQEIRTRLTRGLAENTDLINGPMMFYSGTMNSSQLQRLKKLKVINEGTTGAVRWFSPPPIAGEVLPILSYLRDMRSERVGTDPAAAGLQPDQLTGIAAVAIAGAQQAGARVVRYTVRTFAETGLREAFQKLLRLMLGEPKRTVLTQTGNYVVCDPAQFDPAWGVRARVGLGAMAVQERQQAYQAMIGLTQSILGGMGVDNPLTTPDKAAALIQAAAGEFRGLGAQRFFNTPDEAKAWAQQKQQQQPPPDPKMMKVQADAQAKQQQLQQDGQIKSAQVQADAQAKQQKIATDAQVAREHNLMTHDERVMETALQVPLEKYAIDKKAQSGQGNLPRKAGPPS